ncbi:MAG: HAD family hydrolase [Kiloniellales bacterium]
MNRRTNHRLPPPRALLFDWDDTLVDNWQTIHEALNATFEAMGRPTWSLQETQRNARRSARDRFPQLFGERWQEAQEIFYDAFRRNHLRTLRALPHAETMLSHLQASGLLLAVVSNKNGDFLRREAAHLGWTGYFRRLVGAADATADKPAKAAVTLALRGSGLSCGPEVWFVGDADIDVECARNAGLSAVLLQGPGGCRQAVVGERHALRLSDCAELMYTVDGLLRQL